ncbi:hypothetical protein IFM89_035949 [Coptis chinensis]|uniref:ACT domain-containing protein ACR n=1 Tax=Coptis chinensis TaxID=261450 RepID=A0A835H125_9MAGN|nr:hypothetical protein IFM89_035949 [Coptis chinensis]
MVSGFLSFLAIHILVILAFILPQNFVSFTSSNVLFVLAFAIGGGLVSDLFLPETILGRIRSVGVQATAEHTTIELTGRDRPGLISEIFAVLVDLKCNVGAAEVWTHNSRMASVVYITDDATGSPIDDNDRLSNIKKLLRYVLKGNLDKRYANTTVTTGGTHTERRLHQMMYADRDYGWCDDDDVPSVSDRSKPLVTLENIADKGYTVVNMRCRDRPKLLFDTVCTLTDMQYVVFHATVMVEGPEAYQVCFLLPTCSSIRF